jgi:hypothetical protein
MRAEGWGSAVKARERYDPPVSPRAAPMENGSCERVALGKDGCI